MNHMRVLNVGVIGCGAIADLIHLPAYREIPEANVIAVCDVNKRRAMETARKYHIKTWYADYEKLLERKDIEAVSICTPNFLHCEQAVRAAGAGKHVLLEKPMAITLKECDSIINACQRAHVKLMVGHNERFNPVYEKIKKIVDSGCIGRIFQIRLHVSYSGYAEWPSVTEWFFDPSKCGGGCLIDAGVHHLDVIRWLVGDVISVFAIVGSLKRGRAEDMAMVMLTFKDAIGEFDVNWNYSGLEQSTEILGREGGVFFRRPESPISIYREKQASTVLKGSISPELPVEMAETIAYQKKKIKHFVNAILLGEEPLITGRDGRATVEIVLAAYKSAKTGNIVKLPLE